MRVTGQKKHVFLSKKAHFFWRVSIWVKKNLYLQSKKTFLCVYALLQPGWYYFWSKKHLFVVKKNLFACPPVPSSLEGVHSGQKNPYFQSKKTFLCVHGAPPVWKVSTGECPRGPCSLESVNLGQKKHFLQSKKLFCVSMGPLTKVNGPREGPSGPTKRF